MPSNRDIRFAPVTADDYPLLRRWLESPPMSEWWGEPEAELAKVREKIEGRDRTRPFIFHVDGRPAGYIQHWSVGDELAGGHAGHAPWLREFPADTVGVDLSLGEADLPDRGIGTAVLRAFIARLFAQGCKKIIIDPDETNGRAVRCYEKVGFTVHGRYPTASGVTLLMTITPERLEETGP